jgi:hypothetical protein
MKILLTLSALSICNHARLEAGKADFILLLWNEETQELSLNDAGDIAIPSGTTRSIALEMRWDNECLQNVIQCFISQVTKERC